MTKNQIHDIVSLLDERALWYEAPNDFQAGVHACADALLSRIDKTNQDVTANTRSTEEQEARVS